MEPRPKPELSHTRIYDRHGEPIGLRRFVELWNDPAYRTIASDRIGRYRVETIWLGVDHGPVERPALFETAVHDLAVPLDFRLLSTLAEARTCHRHALEAVMARVPPVRWSSIQAETRWIPRMKRADF